MLFNVCWHIFVDLSQAVGIGIVPKLEYFEK